MLSQECFFHQESTGASSLALALLSMKANCIALDDHLDLHLLTFALLRLSTVFSATAQSRGKFT